MKKPEFNKIALAMFVFALLALLISGYGLVQAREGNNQDVAAETMNSSSAKSDWHYDYFSNYLSWPSSATPVDPDPKRYMIASISYQDSAGVPNFHFVDINGDSLVDMLYFNPHVERYGIYINNGSSEMEPAYLCTHVRTGAYPDYVYTWYGNCVNPSWVWTP